ncbi:hypothetical protein MOB09_19340 [Bacillus vallismortis]|uniref:hypothetical protein n=1 Tax=Bacillus vallismortis TaxID=72361 RepID=UPI00227EF5DB|nr:hypothetical protein [Bacillus vallismortis]MCY7895108.1 hypothetical protein [Bacillus vallismortis]
MEWSKVFDLLKTILTSWPLAAVVIVFAIRKSLKTVIENRLFSFKVGNVEIIFDRLLEKVDQNLEEASQLSEEEKVEPESVKEPESEKEPEDLKEPENNRTEKPRYKNYSEPSVIRPRMLVKASWKEVENEIRSLVIHSESEKIARMGSIRKCIRYLAENVVSPELAEALRNLLELRDLLLNEHYKLKNVDATIFRSRCLSAIDELGKYTGKSIVAN